MNWGRLADAVFGLGVGYLIGYFTINLVLFFTGFSLTKNEVYQIYRRKSAKSLRKILREIKRSARQMKTSMVFHDVELGDTYGAVNKTVKKLETLGFDVKEQSYYSDNNSHTLYTVSWAEGEEDEDERRVSTTS